MEKFNKVNYQCTKDSSLLLLSSYTDQYMTTATTYGCIACTYRSSSQWAGPFKVWIKFPARYVILHRYPGPVWPKMRFQSTVC